MSVSGGPDQLDHIVAIAPVVQNKVAPGATWDGISDLPASIEIVARASDTLTAAE